MSEDSELERLKARRLAEMQENLAKDMPPQEPETPKAGPRDILVSRLGFRGMEVLENAEAQFPGETKFIVLKLAELIRSGELTEVIDGGGLLALFRTVGLAVRMKTQIKVEQDGKMVSLGEKLGTKE